MAAQSSAESTGAPSIGASRPSTRTRTGEPGVMRRSVPPRRMISTRYVSIESTFTPMIVIESTFLSLRGPGSSSVHPRGDLRDERRAGIRDARRDPRIAANRRVEHNVTEQRSGRVVADGGTRGADVRVDVDVDRADDQRRAQRKRTTEVELSRELVLWDVDDVVHVELTRVRTGIDDRTSADGCHAARLRRNRRTRPVHRDLGTVDIGRLRVARRRDVPHNA